jgi:hypothetical protein
MMINFLGWVVRRRVAVLVAAALTAVALQVLLQATGNLGDLRLSLLAGLPVLVLVLGTALAAHRFHPARLVARPEVSALDVPVSPGKVFGAAAYTLAVSPALGMMVRDIAAAENLWYFSAAVGLLLAGMLARFWRAALGQFGVRLSPDGIVGRQVSRSLFVPWEALAAPRAASPRGTQQVTLHLARPELVRQRGLRHASRTMLPAVGVDAELLASTINEYANRADLRPVIGSAPTLSATR